MHADILAIHKTDRMERCMHSKWMKSTNNSHTGERRVVLCLTLPKNSYNPGQSHAMQSLRFPYVVFVHILSASSKTSVASNFFLFPLM